MNWILCLFRVTTADLRYPGVVRARLRGVRNEASRAKRDQMIAEFDARLVELFARKESGHNRKAA